ncbi:MAG: FliH/SctL family protein [Acutalibacter sp.]
MPSIFKRFSKAKAEDYVFPDAEDLVLKDPEPAPQELPLPEREDSEAEPEEPEKLEPAEKSPIQFAQLQAQEILEDAKRQAQELLEKAKADAQEEIERAKAEAADEGQREGYNRGLQEAMETAKQERERLAQELSGQVAEFLEKASAALDKQLDDNVGELRDLAIAIGEKVISVSLKSSGDVIARMVQAALDKRRRREWVRIYIAETDAKRMGQIPASLASSLSAISDRVRIIPMAGEDSGTCVIETPDEIIDASASTQLHNIRSLLMDTPVEATGAPPQIFHT